MYLNEILVDRINRGNFPENTDSVVLSLEPTLDVLVDYVYTFRKRYEDTKTHLYNIVRGYLIKCNTYFYDNIAIMEEMTICINDAWKVYNTMGNQLFVQRYNWGKTSDFALLEFEELDVIYNKEAVQTTAVTTDGTVASYHLYYKPSTKLYFGTVEFYLENNIVSIAMEYTKKPSESKYIKDATAKFCEEYNVVIEA